MAENIYTLKLTKEEENKLFETWKDTKTKAPAYAKWQLRPENCVMTCYASGKTVFQGKDAFVYASPFLPAEKKQISEDILPQAGSDEVGTGDYFGPVCVCASIVTKETDAFLRETGVRDSKQLTDEMIIKMAPEIMKHLPYSLLIVNDEKYNAIHQSNNMNAIKSKLHNQAYVNLKKKYNLPEFKIIDQFTPEKSYYRYLKDQPVIITGIHFETKAENKYPSVGASSIIARYAFIKKMEEMEETWHMHFQKGAGSNVDACAREFVKKNGIEKLGMVAKLHFKNTERL